MIFQPPPPNCPLCPRLVAFRAANQRQFPAFFNGAVPPFGELSAALLVVGLAPGLKGANATGRPFTGDFAGQILYRGLQENGFTEGEYEARADDGFRLKNVRITNAVRCVPPENKPTPAEERACNPFLIQEMAAMPNLRVILCLGLTAHQAVLRTLGLKPSQHKFAHGAEHALGIRDSGLGISKTSVRQSPTPNPQSLILLNSYHTSRYNIQTNRLNQAMFNAVVGRARALLTE